GSLVEKDGNDWRVLDPGPNWVGSTSLMVLDDRFVAASDDRIRAWDGQSWHSIASVTPGQRSQEGVASIMVHDGHLLAAGGFAGINGVPMNMVAQVRLSCCGSPDFDGDGQPGTSDDIAAFF